MSSRYATRRAYWVLFEQNFAMAHYYAPCQITRSDIVSIILRIIALLLNAASIGVISALFLKQIQDILFIILVKISFKSPNIHTVWLTAYSQFSLVAAWSTVDLILLLCGRSPHPTVYIALDTASFAVLAGVGGFEASFAHQQTQLDTQP